MNFFILFKNLLQTIFERNIINKSRKLKDNFNDVKEAANEQDRN